MKAVRRPNLTSAVSQKYLSDETKIYISMNRVHRVVYRIFLGFFKISIIPTHGRYLQTSPLKGFAKPHIRKHRLCQPEEVSQGRNSCSWLPAISFPESSFPLTSGSGYERLWDKAFQLDILLARNRACAIVPEVRKR